jgi:GNAT superfamily N-acetyltransferase
MEIIKRRLAPGEAKIVYQGIRETSNITGHTIQELESYDNTYVAMDGDNLAGVGVWIEVSNTWKELLILFVVEEYRDQGIGKKLFEKIVSER